MNCQYVVESVTETGGAYETQGAVSTEYDHKLNIVELIDFFLSISSETDLQTHGNPPVHQSRDLEPYPNNRQKFASHNSRLNAMAPLLEP